MKCPIFFWEGRGGLRVGWSYLPQKLSDFAQIFTRGSTKGDKNSVWIIFEKFEFLTETGDTQSLPVFSNFEPNFPLKARVAFSFCPVSLLFDRFNWFWVFNTLGTFRGTWRFHSRSVRRRKISWIWGEKSSDYTRF